MPNKMSLEEAVKIVKEGEEQARKYEGIGFYERALQIVLDFATQALEVKGFPPKSVSRATANGAFYESEWDEGFNKALDLCTLAHAKIMEEGELTEEELVEKD